MTLLLMNGFGYYSNHLNHEYSIQGETGIPSIITSGGPYGEPYQPGETGQAEAQYFFIKEEGTPLQTIFYQMHMRAAGNNVDYNLFDIYDTTEETQHIRFRWLSGDELEVRRGTGTILGTSTQALFTEDTWHYFEIKVVIDDTVGEIVVDQNGTNVLNLTGIDTNNGAASDGQNMFEFVGSGNASRQLDYTNLIVMSTAGTRLNGFIGERRIVHLVVDGGTTDVDFLRSSTTSTNWELVDEVPPSGTDYVFSNSTGDVDMYTLSNLVEKPTTMEAMSINLWTRVDDVGPRTYAPRVQVSTDVDESTEAYYPPIDSSGYIQQYILENSPASTSGWNLGAVQDVLAGMKVLT